MRLSIKSTFYAHIGSVKFATNFTESPCSPLVTFPSFGSEGHGVQPPHRGTPFFAIFLLDVSFFFPKIFSFSIHFWSKLRVFFLILTFSEAR